MRMLFCQLKCHFPKEPLLSSAQSRSGSFVLYFYRSLIIFLRMLTQFELYIQYQFSSVNWKLWEQELCLLKKVIIACPGEYTMREYVLHIVVFHIQPCGYKGEDMFCILSNLRHCWFKDTVFFCTSKKECW